MFLDKFSGVTDTSYFSVEDFNGLCFFLRIERPFDLHLYLGGFFLS